jgi:GNAT superfamily N-acetyltransferase
LPSWLLRRCIVRVPRSQLSQSCWSDCAHHGSHSWGGIWRRTRGSWRPFRMQFSHSPGRSVSSWRAGCGLGASVAARAPSAALNAGCYGRSSPAWSLRSAARRTGAGRALLNHIIGVGRSRAYRVLYIETGCNPAFLPAQTLYGRTGFQLCGPFGSYARTGTPYSCRCFSRDSAGMVPRSGVARRV